MEIKEGENYITVNQIKVDRATIIKKPFIRARGLTDLRKKTTCHLFLHLLNKNDSLVIHARYLKISPSKIQPIVILVRKEKNKGIDHSLNLLRFLPNKGAKILYKIIQGAKKQILNKAKVNKKETKK